MSRKIVVVMLSFVVLSLAIAMLWEPGEPKRASASKDGEHRIEVMQQQMEDMQEQLDALKRERAQLAARAAKAPMAPTTAQAVAAQDPAAQPEQARSRAMLEPAVQIQQEKTYFSTYFSELDTKRASERPHERFASEVRARIGTVMQDIPELTQSTIDVVDCGSTLCRIEATHADGDAKGHFLTLFPLHMGGTLNDGTIQADPETLKTTGYFAREGFVRPLASETAMAAFNMPEAL